MLSRFESTSCRDKVSLQRSLQAGGKLKQGGELNELQKDVVINQICLYELVCCFNYFCISLCCLTLYTIAGYLLENAQ